MRYDMKYKKLNVEDNESCNLQCEKKCEKLAGVFICCILAFFLLFLSTRNVGLIYCYSDELSEDSENTAEDAEQEQQKIKETILSDGFFFCHSYARTLPPVQPSSLPDV